MEPSLITDEKLSEVLSELKRREPIFHRPEFGTTRADFEEMTETTFWEVGASGRRYSREYVLDELERRYAGPAPAAQDEWQTRDFHCLEIAADNYLLTYTLAQGARASRAARPSGGGRRGAGRLFTTREPSSRIFKSQFNENGYQL